MTASALAISLALSLTGHDLDPPALYLCGVGETGTFTLTDPTGCTALVTAQSHDEAIATVDPTSPGSVVTQTFEVFGRKIGKTLIEVRYIGDTDECTEKNTELVSVQVFDRCDPECHATLDFGISETYLNSVKQKLCDVSVDVNVRATKCQRLILTQMIKIGDGPWEIDVDPGATGVQTPFYNYDPATGEEVPGDGLGSPGSAAEPPNLFDRPAQSTQPVSWEVCLVCCDDGSVLGCRRWSYDPVPVGGQDDEGYDFHGVYKDDGKSADFSPEARQAYKEGLEAYLESHPDAANDPCAKNFLAALTESTSSAGAAGDDTCEAPSGSSTGGGSSSGSGSKSGSGSSGCATTRHTGTGHAPVGLVVVLLLAIAASGSRSVYSRRW